MSRNPSKNHHWLPQCLMRPWEGSDNLVESFSIQPWGLSSRRKSSKAIGSENNLHRIDLLEEPNLVETIFGRVESSFADAKCKAINKGISALNRNEREEFAFFVALLSNRRPEKLKVTSMEAANSLMKNLGDKIVSASPYQADMVTKNVGKYVAIRASIEFAAEIFPEIVRLEWRIIDFSDIPLKLVLADRPVRAWGEGAKLTQLTFPLGPDHLFVAGIFPPHKEIIFGENFREVLAIDIIGKQFRQAANFVVACSREPYFKLAETIMKNTNAIPPKGTL
ncbi:DUF4238 domain-containing protein [Pseudochelatococcus sp. B33]